MFWVTIYLILVPCSESLEVNLDQQVTRSYIRARDPTLEKPWIQHSKTILIRILPKFDLIALVTFFSPHNSQYIWYMNTVLYVMVNKHCKKSWILQGYQLSWCLIRTRVRPKCAYLSMKMVQRNREGEEGCVCAWGRGPVLRGAQFISISIRTTFMVPVNYLMSTFYYSQKFGLLKFSAVMIWGYFFPNSSIYIPKT